MQPLIKIIRQLADQYLDEWTDIRHHLHQHPELSFEEYQTQQFIAKKLRDYGIEDQLPVARTGILARISGVSPGNKTIVLRSDMDALPIEEENNIPYRSQNKGIMHACGHDVHMTCLLGTARILTTLADKWEGTVILLFQPGEEKVPGGAKKIMESGILSRFRPDFVLGQHVDPSLPAGVVGYRPGKYMASSDEIYLTIKGTGGHAALPGKVTNTPYIAAKILTRLQEIISSEAPDDIPSLLRFGKVLANGATNVLPDRVEIEGTFRTFDESLRREVHQKLTEVAVSLAKEHGAYCEVNIKKGYPVLENNPEATRQAIRFSAEYLGKEHVRNIERRMTSEDFAFYSHHFPSVFFRLGVKDPAQQVTRNLHTSRFGIYEPVLATGTGHLAWLTLSFLQSLLSRIIS